MDLPYLLYFSTTGYTRPKLKVNLLLLGIHKKDITLNWNWDYQPLAKIVFIALTVNIG